MNAFEKLLAELSAASVDFVGGVGLAVAMAGYARATKDVDLLIRVVEDFPLDCYTQMSGYTYEDLLPFRDEHAIGEATIRHLNAEGLILLKKDSLRPEDQLDVQALRDIQRRQENG